MRLDYVKQDTIVRKGLRYVENANKCEMETVKKKDEGVILMHFEVHQLSFTVEGAIHVVDACELRQVRSVTKVSTTNKERGRR